MIFELPPLPYEMNGLEPYISKQTLEFHYGKHHQAYVNNLNKLIEGTDFENSGIEDIILNATGGIFNNAAQVWNHTFYWNCLTPGGNTLPAGKLADELDKAFVSFDIFKEKFTSAAATLFGSGWAWLVKDENNQLEIVQTGNAGNPLCESKTPLLVCDVWEHAYYLDRQNRRPEYIDAFWQLVDWDAVAERF